MNIFIAGTLWLLFFEVAFANTKLTGLLILGLVVNIIFRKVIRGNNLGR